ncbi:MAG: hypothetical protein ACRD9Y_26025, partial [Blastocatellia bacterium]
NKGDHAWMITHGDGQRKAVNEAIKAMSGKDIDVGPLGAGGGGPLLTKTLLFVGQGAGGRGGRAGGGANLLRAFDKATGKVIAEVVLPAQPSGTPMTYLAGGKQYIVVATADGRLIALGLPENSAAGDRIGQ